MLEGVASEHEQKLRSLLSETPISDWEIIDEELLIYKKGLVHSEEKLISLMAFDNTEEERVALMTPYGAEYQKMVETVTLSLTKIRSVYLELKTLRDQLYLK